METTSSSNNRHTIAYDILNMIPNKPLREIEVHASREELERMAKAGYLIRERLFAGEELQTLRDALDRLERKERENGVGEGGTKNFGGFFMRYLMDKDPAFMALMKYQPIMSVARAMLGHQVQVSMSARISAPSPENQETMWHQHLRYIPKPLPLWFLRPHCIDVLIYLDDVTDANGPLCIIPGSHENIQEEPPIDYYGDLPGQLKLYPPAGTAVIMHCNLWHRAMPTLPEGSRRRLLIFSIHPTWLKRNNRGTKPEHALTDTLLPNADQETLELLGKIGYM
ncbi:MAG: phytanoyl-CoA dioxygenase family protein [Paenibacillaceae bacterium]|nr:phytanoyl-CoA dioxygenase family protein [Paenibacillaceae bacterium]